MLLLHLHFNCSSVINWNPSALSTASLRHCLFLPPFCVESLLALNLLQLFWCLLFSRVSRSPATLPLLLERDCKFSYNSWSLEKCFYSHFSVVINTKDPHCQWATIILLISFISLVSLFIVGGATCESKEISIRNWNGIFFTYYGFKTRCRTDYFVELFYVSKD